MNIVEKVKKTIIEYEMIKKGDRVLVALSGGSDSVAMLHILNSLKESMGFSLCAAHINHNIRAEAKRDEDFVSELCQSLGIECFVKSVKVLEYAKEKGISTELAGREIRYSFFDEIKEKHSIDKIATAHNRNDSAESILLHLTRGCGVSGLSGIEPVVNGKIIRPIIEIFKNEIEQYCFENGYEFVIDKTNFETDYTRNKIRLLLMPLIEQELNPNFMTTITENAPIFAETADFIDSYSQKVYNRVCYKNRAKISELLAEEPAVIRCVLQKMYCNYTNKAQRLSVKYTDAIMDILKSKKTSKTLNLASGVSARVEYGYVFFEKTELDKIQFSYEIGVGEKKYIPEADVTLLLRRENEKLKNTEDKIYFYAKEDSSFRVRNRQRADTFLPVGMSGRKKLSDFLCDLKISSALRDKIPLLLCDDVILWVVKKRVSREFQNGEALYSCEVISN